MRYYDTEHNAIITESELREEFNELKANGETDSTTFDEYVNNCLTVNNGTLERM